MKKLVYFLIALLFMQPVPLIAADPMETLRTPIDKVISILNDPQYKDQSKKEFQRQKMWEIVNNIFDFKFISKSVLGKFHWEKTFNEKEKEEFTYVFSRFLGNTYIDKIQNNYENEKVVFINQEIMSPSKSVVRTEIPRKSANIPIEYKMKLNNDQWAIYDVNIEGVSLVENYRSQIRSILMNQTAAQLISQLESKLKEQPRQKQ